MLTFRELRTIREGHLRNPDILTLLREIRRLRDLAAQTYGALGFMPLDGLGKENMDALTPVLSALMEEPAVKEYLLMRSRKEALEFQRQRHTTPPAA